MEMPAARDLREEIMGSFCNNSLISTDDIYVRALDEAFYLQNLIDSPQISMCFISFYTYEKTEM